MHIGIGINTPSFLVDVAFIARKVEDLGFESLWYAEHPIVPLHTNTIHPLGHSHLSQAHFGDPFISLARASAVTSTIKLGTSICLLPERNPLLLAKEISTLDLYSKGRFIFGVGVGWLREETEIMGGDFDHRWTQAREAVAVMKELWTKEEAEYHGRYYDFPPVVMYPKPFQKPHPPILIGGMAKNVFKRTVAWGDGYYPNQATPEHIKHARSTLNELASEAGRDPASITISVDHPNWPINWDTVKQFEEAGADRVVLRPTAPNSEEELTANLELISENVLH